MIQIPSNKLGTLLEILRQQSLDFIVIGEMHGSKQNAPLIQELLTAILTEPKPITVAFEWTLSNSEREELQTYIHGGEVPTRLSTFFLNSDGRFTYEHASLLRWISTYNKAHDNLIDLHTFDESVHSEEVERAMAGSLRAYRENHPKSVILIEAGNMHARILPYVSKDITSIPMVAILKKDYAVFSIFLRYLQGEISVGRENRDVTRAASQQEGPGSYFDAVIEVPVSEAASNPDSLTKIVQLLQSESV